MVHHVRAKVRLVVGEEGYMFQERGEVDCSGTDGGSHSVIWIVKSGQCIGRIVEVLLRGGAGFFNTFICGGELRWGGCQNIIGLSWYDSKEFDLDPVFPVEHKFNGGYLVGKGWRVLMVP